MTSSAIINKIFELSNEETALKHRRFFKTGKGDYAEHDKFIGVSMPKLRLCIKNLHPTPYDEIEILLESEFHEIRMAGLLILVEKFGKKKLYDQKETVDFYLKNLESANNWDLVDSTAYQILGTYLNDKPKDILFNLAQNQNVWERRVAIVSTLAFIKKEDFQTTFDLLLVLKQSPEDILQKAMGWALREVMKKGGKIEGLQFIEKFGHAFPSKVISIGIQDLLPEEKSQVRAKVKASTL